MLHEKRLDFKVEQVSFWLREEKFLEMNPLGTVPVLVEDSGVVLVGSSVIVEFLEELEPNPGELLSGDIYVRAEARRISAWFDEVFFREVNAPLITHKLLKRIWGRENGSAAGISIAFSVNEATTSVLRLVARSIRFHLDYLSWLLRRSDWLVLSSITLADLAVAAHLSVSDYFDMVPWQRYPAVKQWYAKIKSRPSFRFILADRHELLRPPNHYSDPDF